MARPRARSVALVLVLLAACGAQTASTPPASTALAFRRVADTGGPQSSVRLARDPAAGALHVLKLDGDVFRLQAATGALERVHTAAETGVAAPQGMAFGPEGTLYLVGNEGTPLEGMALVRRGVRGSDGRRTWSTLARTAAYPRSNTAYDHQFNGIAVSPDGRSVFVSSGSRTDHGEVQDAGGVYPGLREVPLTARVFRLPAAGTDLLLLNDETGLAPFAFAQGLRNSFDPAFDAAGNLFSGDNSGDRDDNDELNWLREGQHYGFPWRQGTNDTPQQFPGYDPEADRLVNHAFHAYRLGFFRNDPTYPPRPSTALVDPIPNLGPDANSFRDPATGAVRKASELGRPLSTFTTHRSPLGLVFDNGQALPGRYRGGAFLLGWTEGDASGDSVAGPFRDPGQDLLFLDLTRSGDGYQVRAQSLACGFRNPIDAEIQDGKLYVLEFGGAGTVWEVTLPAAEPAGGRTCTSVPR